MCFRKMLLSSRELLNKPTVFLLLLSHSHKHNSTPPLHSLNYAADMHISHLLSRRLCFPLTDTCRHTSQRILQKMGFLQTQQYDSLLSLYLSINCCSFSQQFTTGKGDFESSFAQGHMAPLLFQLVSCQLPLTTLFPLFCFTLRGLWQAKQLKYHTRSFPIMAHYSKNHMFFHACSFQKQKFKLMSVWWKLHLQRLKHFVYWQ